MLILCFDENDFKKLCMRYLCSDFHFEDLFRKLKNKPSYLKPEGVFCLSFKSSFHFQRDLSPSNGGYICGQLVGHFYSRLCET